MCVPTSEVGYSPAIPRMRTTKSTRTCGGIGQKNTTPYKRMEGFKRIFRHILISDLDEFVNFTLQLFHSQWKISRYLLNRKLGGSRRLSGCGGDNRLCLCGGSKRQIFKPSCRWENNTKKDMRERWIKAWAVFVRRIVVKSSKNLMRIGPCIILIFE